jgi:prephenate dehydratase
MSTSSIAFQGEPGAYSEQAVRVMVPGAETLPCTTFEDVFAAISHGDARYACIPIENSVAGRVADIHHLLPQYDIRIVAEHFEPIHHQLLGVQGATLDQMSEVHSHIHALGQCRTLIGERGLRAVIHTDTAGAAKDVAAWNDPTKAAIASRLAGELYGLEVLQENIEDADHNTTRFLLIAMQDSVVAREAFPPASVDVPAITSLFFTARSVPAALYKAIGGFATNGINLTKIESYVTGQRLSIAQFYIDVEGHPDSEAMRHALDELAYFSSEVRVLGTYPASGFRRSEEV